jgi:hypothetical protein
MFEVQVPPLRHPVLVWVGAVTALGTFAGLALVVQGAPQLRWVVELYIAVGLPFWLALGLGRKVRCEQGAITWELSLPWIGRIGSRRRVLTGLRAVRVRVREQLGVFTSFERHRPELLLQDRSILLPATATPFEAQHQVRQLAKLLRVPDEAEKRMPLRATPLLLHARFSAVVLTFLLLFSGPWWLALTPLDDGSLGNDLYQRTQVAYSLCFPFSLIAMGLFLRGAHQYYAAQRSLLAASAVCFMCLVSLPYWAERALRSADFEDAFQVDATSVGVATRWSEARSIERPGLGFKRVPLDIPLSQERWAQQMMYTQRGATQRALVELPGPLPAGARVALWVSRRDPTRALLLSERDALLQGSAADAGIALAFALGALLSCGMVLYGAKDRAARSPS